MSRVGPDSAFPAGLSSVALASRFSFACLPFGCNENRNDGGDERDQTDRVRIIK